MELLLKGGVLHDPAAGWNGPAEILIKQGKVEAVSTSLESIEAPVLDLTGKVILPGPIDMHVHLREPGGEGKETIATGAAAAVAGGFTAVACMPNTFPAVDSREIVSYVRKRAAETALAHVYPIGALTRGLKGREISLMWELAQEGVKGFSNDGIPLMDSGVMLRAMQYALLLDMPVISHAEDSYLSAGGVVHAGEHGYRLGLPTIPSSSEAVMVARDLLLQEEVGGKLHLAHLSCRQSVELVKWALEREIVLTAEVTPHHLFLTEQALEDFNTSAKVNPPLRSAADREALVKALGDGVIQVVATDHAPHMRLEKEEGLMDAPFGAVGLETALPLLWTLLVDKGLLTPLKLVEAISSFPARILNVPGGTLQKGSPADLVVIDPYREHTVEPREFYSKGKNTPFGGWTLKGLPVITMVGGDIKMWKGMVKGFSDEFPREEKTFFLEGIS